MRALYRALIKGGYRYSLFPTTLNASCIRSVIIFKYISFRYTGHTSRYYVDNSLTFEIAVSFIFLYVSEKVKGESIFVLYVIRTSARVIISRASVSL